MYFNWLFWRVDEWGSEWAKHCVCGAVKQLHPRDQIHGFWWVTQAAQFPAKTFVQFKKNKKHRGYIFFWVHHTTQNPAILIFGGRSISHGSHSSIHPFFTSQAMSENQRPAGAVLQSASSRLSVTWPGSDFRCSWWMWMKPLPVTAMVFVCFC